MLVQKLSEWAQAAAICVVIVAIFMFFGVIILWWAALATIIALVYIFFDGLSSLFSKGAKRPSEKERD